MSKLTKQFKYEPVRKYFTTINDQTGKMTDILDNYERTTLFNDRSQALKYGFARWGHDDFNIAVWDEDRLVSWDWMFEPIGEPVEELERIQKCLVSGSSCSVLGDDK